MASCDVGGSWVSETVDVPETLDAGVAGVLAASCDAGVSLVSETVEVPETLDAGVAGVLAAASCDAETWSCESVTSCEASCDESSSRQRNAESVLSCLTIRDLSVSGSGCLHEFGV